jgi:HK97 family phage major capsid protein/HK97 family phage prohead protease
MAIKGQHSRQATFDRASADESQHTVEVAFSSEAPVERSFGSEVLDHDPQSVRLARLNGGAAVLVNHDVHDQIGVVESARIDGDRRGRALIRFSKSTRGQEVFQDVKDGIRKHVSVGYEIHDYKEGSRDKKRVVTATDWEPFEVSLVAIPADVNAGVGRSAEQPTPEASTMETKTEEQKTEHRSTPAAKIDPEKERANIRTEEKQRIDAIRAQADKWALDELAREAISEGWSVAQFNERALVTVGERNNAARVTTRAPGDVDLSPGDLREFSLVRLMDALATPNDKNAQKRAAFELEVSSAAQMDFGGEFKCRGEFVPQSLLTRTLTAGTATDGAELVGTNLLAASFIEVLRNAMVTQQAGLTILPGLIGDVAIPRQTTGAAATWISAEDGDATEDEAQFDQVTLTPKDLACYTEVTRRLRLQSTPSIEGLVRRDLALAQALGVDLAVMYGTGASGQPTGITLQTGVNTLDLAAADPTYAELVNMVRLVMDDNALMGSPSWMLSPAGWEALMTTPKQGSGVEGNFILGESNTVVGYPMQVSNQVTTEEYIFGDFSQAILGEWGGLEIMVDNSTHSLKGRTRYVMFKTCDVAVRHPGAFCYAHDGIV